MNVTERIEHLLQERGWSVYRLGKVSGLSQSTLAHIFRKDSEPTIATLETICNAFGITLSQFFAEDEFVALTEEQRNLLAQWATLTDEQKQLILNMISHMQ